MLELDGELQLRNVSPSFAQRAASIGSAGVTTKSSCSPERLEDRRRLRRTLLHGDAGDQEPDGRGRATTRRTRRWRAGGRSRNDSGHACASHSVSTPAAQRRGRAKGEAARPMIVRQDFRRTSPGHHGGTAPQPSEGWTPTRDPAYPRDSPPVTPRAGLEPATLRLTAGCSTIELPRIARAPVYRTPAGAT